jgi:hypothetical protein
MERNTFTIVAAIAVIGIGALVVMSTHRIHDSSDAVVPQERDNLVSSAPATTHSTGSFLSSHGYGYADYVHDHPVTDANASKWAKNLFISQQFDASIRYSKSVLLESTDRGSVEVLPILMSSYKSIGENGNARFTQFVHEYVLHVASLPPTQENTERLDDFLSNIRILLDASYSIREQIDVYETLTAPGMPPIAVHYGEEIKSDIDYMCNSGGCNDINAHSYT